MNNLTLLPDLARPFELMKLDDSIINALKHDTSFAADCIRQGLQNGKRSDVYKAIADQYKVAPVEMEMMLGLRVVERVMGVMGIKSCHHITSDI